MDIPSAGTQGRLGAAETLKGLQGPLVKLSIASKFFWKNNSEALG